jgi:ABC-type multidrug transport system fused ATPase/permease subunit
VQAGTSFALVRVLGIAARQAITDLRREVSARAAAAGTVLRLHQTGILLNRVMNDAEGIRNLVGTGLVQLAGRLLTAAIAMVALFWLNWRLTAGRSSLLAFGGGMAFAFAAPPDLPGAQQADGGGERAADRVVRRDPDREVVRRRAARTTPSRRRSPAVPQCGPPR